jgi:Ca2+-transporting ATPase
MVFAGTTAAYGHGRAVVTGTGMNTELGKIAGLLEQAGTESTPLQRQLEHTGKRLGTAVVFIALVVVAAVLFSKGAFGPGALLDALLFGVSLAVAAVPEGLAAIVAVVLAIGVQRMARRGAIVRKLPAVEALGSATVIASDKTGTLTRNEMTVRVVVTHAGRLEVEGSGYVPEGHFHDRGAPVSEAHWTELRCLLTGAALANNSTLASNSGVWSVTGDPTEGALIVAAQKGGIEKSKIEQRFKRVREIPFSSERKMMSTLHQDREGDRRVAWSKGAPDMLLDRCKSELQAGGIQPLTDHRRRELRRLNGELTEQALRTLAVAYREIPEQLDWLDCESDKLERELILVGFIGMIDPPRPEVRNAVERAKAAGIRPIMITGDHPGTAIAIAEELGIGSRGQAVTGQELDGMDSSELSSRATRISIYARVNPTHKLRIVDALQADGAIVAMTGDGANDAPALKAADIGIAMGITGTDVSKEAADVVLTDDNFATIVAAVEEGRAIFANIRKFLWYLLSSNCGEVFTIFFGVLFAELLGLRDQQGLILPLLATQILWINLITDGPPALALGVDPPEGRVMRRPPRRPDEHVITGQMWITVGLVGLVMAISTLLVLDGSLPGGLIDGSGDVRYGRTMAFTTLVLCQLFNAFNSRSNHVSALLGRRNNWLHAAILLSIVLHICVIHVSFFQQAFQTTPLNVRDWTICLVASSGTLWIVEAYKWGIRRFTTG